VTAASLWRQSAEQGNAGAQSNLGLLYFNGQRVPKDRVKAAYWWRKSAEQGNADAQSSLSLLYTLGSGVPRDLASAYAWANLAAAKGEQKAKEMRDALENGMTPDQIAEAQSLNLGQSRRTTSTSSDVHLQGEGGVLVVPTLINNALLLKFVIDSGAAAVSVPIDVVLTLLRSETLTPADFIGEKTYRLADGTKVPSKTFRIRSLKVGDIVLKDVDASVSSASGLLLLGQSFLGRFKSWSIDNTRQVLVLTPKAILADEPYTERVKN
jgi:predicted aspartyl protease